MRSLRGIYEFAHSIHNWNLQTFDESRPFAVRAALAWQANVLVSIVESDVSTGLEELSQANVPLVWSGINYRLLALCRCEDQYCQRGAAA